ncbi:MAG: IS3 family transposase [Thermoleophilaceae bacterium]
MSAFIDERRQGFGVEPICRALDVSASAYYQRKTGARSTRAIEDERLLAAIREVHESNYFAYGYRRMWKALRRSGEPAGRGRVQRLMRTAGIQGAKRRGKPWRTTKPDFQATRRPDLVERNFKAYGPDRLLGRRPHLPALLAGARVLRLRNRRLQPQGGRLAAGLAHAHDASA